MQVKSHRLNPAVLLFDFYSYLNKTKYFIICVFYKCLYELGVNGEVLVAEAVAAAIRFQPALQHCAPMLSHSGACGASVKTSIRTVLNPVVQRNEARAAAGTPVQFPRDPYMPYSKHRSSSKQLYCFFVTL